MTVTTPSREAPSKWRVIRTQPVASGLGTWSIPNALRQIEAHEKVDFVTTSNSETEDGIIAALREHEPVHLVLTTYGRISEKVLQVAVPLGLRAVVKSGTGVDAIDFPACKRWGIPVVNIPDYGAAAVAETALLLLITLSRNYNTIYHRHMARTGWCDPDIPFMKGVDLFNKKVGIVGLGHIGSHFGMIALGLGMHVCAYDKFLTQEEMLRCGPIEKIESLEEVCSTCDVITIFLPLNTETRGLISREMVALFRPHTLLINVARGAICDEEALVEALKVGRMGGLGLDVFVQEPIDLSETDPDKQHVFHDAALRGLDRGLLGGGGARSRGTGERDRGGPPNHGEECRPASAGPGSAGLCVPAQTQQRRI